ncbi:MAG TPA: MipA/OmpV family protein [Lysobacter sp.]
MTRTRLAVLTILLTPGALLAQEAPSVAVPRTDLPRWSLGIGGAVRNSEFAGEGTRTLAIPYFGFEGDRFYLRGATVGYRFVENPSFVVSTFVAGRFDGLDADDFGRAELARRGIDRDLLSDRDDSADLGLAIVHRSAAGELELDARGDVTDASGGYQLSLEYRHPFRIGEVAITPGVGANWLSKDMANYYYGTLDEEVARGVVDYKPGEALVPYATLGVFVPLGPRWMLSANAQYRALPDELQDSPLVEEGTDSTSMVLVALARRF